MRKKLEPTKTRSLSTPVNVGAAIQEHTKLQVIRMIDGALSSPEAYQLRKLLNTEVDVLLAKQVDAACLTGEHVDVAKVFKVLTSDVDKKISLRTNLSAEPFLSPVAGTAHPTYSVLEVLERTLMSFDLVALLVLHDMPLAKEVARAHKAIFEYTAMPLLRFIAVQRQLRGEITYRSHYIGLLKALRVDIDDLKYFK